MAFKNLKSIPRTKAEIEAQQASLDAKARQNHLDHCANHSRETAVFQRSRGLNVEVAFDHKGNAIALIWTKNAENNLERAKFSVPAVFGRDKIDATIQFINQATSISMIGYWHKIINRHGEIEATFNAMFIEGINLAEAA